MPLVFGWMHFDADGQTHYRAARCSALPAGPLAAVDGIPRWFAFHGLALAGVAVAVGAAYFLVARLRHADDSRRR